MSKDQKRGNKSKEQHLLFGINSIQAVLERDPSRCLQLLLQDSGGKISQRLQSIESLARTHGISIAYHDKRFFSQLDGNHQGVAAYAKPQPVLRDADLDQWLANPPETPLLLVLDQVQDPHNLGAILRTADAAGVNAVIVSNNNTAPINATVSKIASGAAEQINVYRVTNIARTLDKLKEQGIWIAGTSDQADTSLYATDLTGPIALVMGGEGNGMRQLTTQKCDYLMQLPMQGIVSSLNVSVAAGVCLYEINRQRMQSQV